MACTECQPSLGGESGHSRARSYHSRFGGALLRLEENGVLCGAILVLALHFGVRELYKSTCQQMLLSRYHRMLERDVLI
jgi:hypothetical protein